MCIELTIYRGCEPGSVVPVSYTHLDVYKRQAFDMADFTIGSFDVIAGDGLVTAQMRIHGRFVDVLRLRFVKDGCRNRQARWVRRWAPHVRSAPIVGITVVPHVHALMLPGDGLVRVDVGAVLHLLFGE